MYERTPPTPEHGPRRNLHIVAKLEVRGKAKCLRHSDVTPCLEHHHGNWATGKRVSNNQLGYDTS